jgi:hypothetical protein
MPFFSMVLPVSYLTQPPKPPREFFERSEQRFEGDSENFGTPDDGETSAGQSDNFAGVGDLEKNLFQNQQELISWFDVYRTLKHIAGTLFFLKNILIFKKAPISDYEFLVASFYFSAAENKNLYC